MSLATRSLLLCALAGVEFLVLQLGLDQRAILESPRWWARLLWYYPALFNAALISAGCASVVARHKIGALYVRWVRDEGNSRWGAFLAAHALLATVFLALSLAGFQRGVAAGEHADAWFLLWLASGLLTAAAWCCAVVRPSLLAEFWRESSPRIVWGLTLGLALWLGAESLGGELFVGARLPTLFLVAALLRALGFDPSIGEEPATITVQGFGVEMSGACLGYEGIALVLAFSAAYLFALRRELSFPRALALMPIAVAASFSMNLVRLVALIVLGAHNAEYAVEGFHSVAGWFFFTGIAALVVRLSQHRWFSLAATEPAIGPAARNPAAPYLLPMIVLLATAMGSRVFTGAFDALYPLRVAFVAAVLFWYRGTISGLGWRGSSWAVLPGALVFVGWMALEPSPAPSPIPGGLASLSGGAALAWLALRALGSILTVPIAEELAFRGYLARKLTAADFEGVDCRRLSMFAVAVSSVLFGAMHGRFLAGTLAGLAFAATAGHRGRLADSIVAHGTANTLIALYVLSTRTWSVWD